MDEEREIPEHWVDVSAAQDGSAWDTGELIELDFGWDVGVDTPDEPE